LKLGLLFCSRELQLQFAFDAIDLLFFIKISGCHAGIALVMTLSTSIKTSF
jgi:hypothetical protein